MKFSSLFHAVMVAVFALSSGVVSACPGSRRPKIKVHKTFKKPVVKSSKKSVKTTSKKKHKRN